MDERAIDWILWGAAFAASALLVFFSLGPPPTGVVSWVPDKVFHITGYAATILLYLLAAVWRPGRGYGGYPRAALAIATGAVLMSIVIEVLQSTLFSRTAEVLDVLANMIGSAFALGLWVGLRFTSEARWAT